MSGHCAFVTGTSSGLGKALAENLLSDGWAVYGCSRRRADLKGAWQEIQSDFSSPDSLNQTLENLLTGLRELELVVLNAGMNPGIKLMTETTLDEIRTVMNVNVWANKIIIDWLIQSGIDIGQVVVISSGAGVGGRKGWSAYGLSKSTLNMLVKLYAHELAPVHISSIAPGVTWTGMLKDHVDDIDLETFPNLRHFVDARESGTIQSAEEAASRLLNVLGRLKEAPSGQYHGPELMKIHGG